MVTQPEFIDFEKNYNNVKPTPFEEFGNLWMLDQRCRVIDSCDFVNENGLHIFRTCITLECVKPYNGYTFHKYSNTIYELNCDFCFHSTEYKAWPNTWLKEEITQELKKLEYNSKNTCRRRFQKGLLSLPFGNYFAPYLQNLHVEDIIKLFPKKIIID
jgi:hypothetical protein